MTLILASTAEAAHLPLMMFTVFGSAKLMAVIFERLRMPGIVGEILAGIVIGPSLLGWIQPDQFLGALAELGVMFLLFQVGLEVKSSELLRVGLTATLVAVLGVILPFVLGYAIVVLWGQPTIEAIFMGAAMVATSVGITARVLAGKGLLQARASKIILAAAVIDDVLALLVLAVVSGLAKGTLNPLAILATTAMAIGFTVVVAKWGRQAIEPVVQKVEEKVEVAESQFALAMILMFGLAVLSVYMGVAAIIGAFLAGMALSETASHRVHDLVHGVSELLVPFFLAGIGLHFNLFAFSKASTLLLAVAILAAAVVSKWIGCGVGAWSMGRADAMRIGVGMVPRGEVGMVVAQIGLGLGTISQEIYGVVVFMAVMTTVVAPPLLTWAFRDVEAGEPADALTIG
jgi:Kef-type K+ transport system membrane component KefB